MCNGSSHEYLKNHQNTTIHHISNQNKRVNGCSMLNAQCSRYPSAMLYLNSAAAFILTLKTAALTALNQT